MLEDALSQQLGHLVDEHDVDEAARRETGQRGGDARHQPATARRVGLRRQNGDVEIAVRTSPIGRVRTEQRYRTHPVDDRDGLSDPRLQTSG